MAMTLAEAQKLGTNDVYRGVVKTSYTHSDVLKFLLWKSFKGNAYQYTRENSAGGAAFYDVGDTISEAATTLTQVTVQQRKIVGDVEIDDMISDTVDTDGVDNVAEQIELKTKDVVGKYEDAVINGVTASKQFDGLAALCTGGNSNLIGCNNDAANGATLALDDIDRLIDTVKGQTDLLIMSHRSRRKVLNLFRASGASMEVREEFGRPIHTYAGIPIAVSNWISDAQTKGASTDCSKVFAVSLAPGFGVVGLYPERKANSVTRPDTGTMYLPGPEVVDVGKMETRDANKYRVRWYASLAVYSLRGIAGLEGVRP